MPQASRIVYPIKSQPKRPFPKRVLYAIFAAAGLGILAGGSMYVLRLPYFQISRIEVTGNRLLSAEDIEEAAAEELSGVQWLVIPRASFFVASGEAMEHKLRRRFSQIETADVSRRLPDRITIRIAERRLWGVYCALSCFYLDTNGTAYEELGSFAGSLLPVIYGSQTPASGDQAVAPETLEFFERAKTSLAELGAVPLTMTFSTSTPEDVKIGLSEGWELWVTISRPVEEWLAVLKTVLEKDVGQRRGGLQYIDLRFGNKVFYKYK